MKRGDRAVLLLVLSCAGILLLLTGGVIWFPKLWSERKQSIEIMSKLQNKQTIEAQAKTFFNDLRTRGEQFETELTRLEARLENASFTPRNEKSVSEFVEELQKVISHPGVTLLSLSYQTRIVDDRFLTLPFEARFESDYPGMRLLLHSLETHRAGIFIERLEFQSFSNERRRLVYKIACRVRFS
ncbi:MAG TPA: GspMb/PilO family protein, partial [Candidatus Ozemobacteraceae bacterium]|nr:GspMb/PilO family protein [Candidatus Ozemobacteraceae bacterium]